jgi:predicted nicotinamide N-methyase
MPGYRTAVQTVALDGAASLRLRTLADRQQFDDPQGEAAAQGIGSALWPLFGLLWPSGVQLAQQLLQRPRVAGERVLEVGCGLALASLVGHRLGLDMTASDRHPLAGPFLAHNVALNALPPLPYAHGNWDASARQVAGTVKSRFELILGSDVLYDRDSSRHLAGFIGRHASDGAEVWVVDPNRANRSGFNRALHGLGFGVTDERIDCSAQGGHAAYRGRLLRYRQR